MHNFFYIFISILYMFRAAMCPSSRELIVSLQHLVCRSKFQSNLHTRLTSTLRDIYQISYWYSWISWWWAHGWPKHVENRNKHIKKIVHQVGLFTNIIKFYVICPVAPDVFLAEGQTNTHDEASVAFRNSAKAPKFNKHSFIRPYNGRLND